MFTIFDQTAIDHGIERTRPVGTLAPRYNVPGAAACVRCGEEPTCEEWAHMGLGQQCGDEVSYAAEEARHARARYEAAGPDLSEGARRRALADITLKRF